MDAIGKTLKALANGFNILSILLNDNVESVSCPHFHHVESMLKEWKSL